MSVPFRERNPVIIGAISIAVIAVLLLAAFRAGDLPLIGGGTSYKAAFSEAISRTSTEHAPWYVIPADKKWYRNWAVATIMIDVLEGLDLRFPAPQPGLDAVVID